MMDDLNTLADRVEAATGPDRQLDAEIDWTVRGEKGAWYVAAGPGSIFSHVPGWWRDAADLSHNAPRYSASIDAALTLVPDDAFWRLGHDGDGADPSEFRAQVIVPKLGGNDVQGKAIASTAPLALTASALRAGAKP